MPEKLAEDFPRGKLISRGEGGGGQVGKQEEPAPRIEARGGFQASRQLVKGSYTMPWAIIASATFLKPAMLAPAT